MKPGATKKPVKKGRKVLALFSKLSGLGIVGFANYQSEQKKEKALTVKEDPSICHKAANVLTDCQKQKKNKEQFNNQPGKYHHSYTSIDLWYYLS